jgi:hypothetical protein
MSEILEKSFVGNTHRECWIAYQQFIREGRYAVAGSGGDHFYELDHIWTEFLGVSQSQPGTHGMHKLIVLYKVEFQLNDGAM